MTTKIFSQQYNCHLRSVGVRTVLSRCFLLAIGCLTLMQGKSQSDKRLAMADRYFAAGDYFTAAGLYGQFLQTGEKTKYKTDFPLNIRHATVVRAGKYQSKTDVLFKQAESYRLANYWKEAAALYSQCLEKDSVKYTAGLFWCAVCQRSLGDYDGAESNLRHFLSQSHAGSDYYDAAIEEQKRVLFAKVQLTRPDSVMFHTQKIKTDFGDHGVFAPIAVTGDQILFTSTQAGPVKAGTNPYHNRLFQSSLKDNDLQNRTPVRIESVDSALNQGAACMSPDHQHLYLTQWKRENGQTSSSIYYSDLTSKGWSKPQLLASVNETGHNSKQPFCSSDGKYLFFASDRTGGKGGFDIWYAPLRADGTTGQAINADAINSKANEQAPFYHNTSSTLVFASDRMPGMGGYDLFSATGSPGAWNEAENMGSPVNSSRDDIYFFANEKEALLDHAIISSDRGSECCLAVYAISKARKQRVITGLVLDCAVNQPLDSTKVIFKDASGKRWETTTGPGGQYIFHLSDDAVQHQIFVSREKYNDKLADVPVEKVVESSWQTDTLHNAALCLEKKVVLKIENIVTVYFDFAKSDLTERVIQQLDSIYNVVSENPGYRLQISGFTDGKGSIAYNKKLSEKRAKACADYLIQKGIAPERVVIESFGALFPAEMELINGRDNAEGRSKNRRALIHIDKE